MTLTSGPTPDLPDFRGSSISRPINAPETVAEVAGRLRGTLDFAKDRLSNPIQRQPNVFSAPWGTVEQFPVDSYSFSRKNLDGSRKGLVLNADASLNRLCIEGMDPQEAMDAALDELVGPRQPIPSKFTNRDLYMVACGFAHRESSTVPRMFLGRVEPREDALQMLIDFYEYVLDPNVHSPEWHTTSERENEMRVRFLANQDTARQEIEKLRGLQAASDEPPCLMWTSGFSDMTVAMQLMSLSVPEQGAGYHLVEIPVIGESLDADRGGAALSGGERLTQFLAKLLGAVIPGRNPASRS